MNAFLIKNLNGNYMSSAISKRSDSPINSTLESMEIDDLVPKQDKKSLNLRFRSKEAGHAWYWNKSSTKPAGKDYEKHSMREITQLYFGTPHRPDRTRFLRNGTKVVMLSGRINYDAVVNKIYVRRDPKKFDPDENLVRRDGLNLFLDVSWVTNKGLMPDSRLIPIDYLQDFSDSPEE